MKNKISVIDAFGTSYHVNITSMGGGCIKCGKAIIVPTPNIQLEALNRAGSWQYHVSCFCKAISEPWNIHSFGNAINPLCEFLKKYNLTYLLLEN